MSTPVTSVFDLLPNRSRYVSIVGISAIANDNIPTGKCKTCREPMRDKFCVRCHLTSNESQFELARYGFPDDRLYVKCKKCTACYLIVFRNNSDIVIALYTLQASHNRRHEFEGQVSTECEELTPNNQTGGLKWYNRFPSKNLIN